MEAGKVLIQILQEIKSMRMDIKEVNEEILQIKEEMSALKEDISVLKEDSVILKQDINKTKIKVNSMKKDIKDMNIRSEEIQDTINNVEFTASVNNTKLIQLTKALKILDDIKYKIFMDSNQIQ